MAKCLGSSKAKCLDADPKVAGSSLQDYFTFRVTNKEVLDFRNVSKFENRYA